MWPYLIGGVVVLVIAIGGFFWWRKRKRDEHRLVSFVALLKEPRPLEAVYLQTAAKKAWDADLSLGEDAEGEDGFIVGEDFSCFVMFRGRIMLVNNFPSPYMDDAEKFAESIPDLRLRQIVAEHTAWMSVDAMGASMGDDPETVRDWYRVLGPLLAEFVDENCLGIYMPDRGRLYAANPETLEMLRSEDPLAKIEAEGGETPVFEVSDDDPAMQKAVEEARRRWPEFVTAFEADNSRQAAVKAPICRGDNCEFIWIEVTAIENDVIYGKLGNEPVNLPGLKLGSRVRTTVAELNDWGYVDEKGEFIGGFTVAVMMKAAERAKKKR